MNGRPSVLIIDDDHDIRDAVQSVLEEEGYDTTAAANGREGLERLQTMQEPSLILLDLMMPVMTGIEFLREIKSSKPHANIPVVIISAYNSVADHAGAEAFLHKPVDLGGLIDAVTRYSKPLRH